MTAVVEECELKGKSVLCCNYGVPNGCLQSTMKQSGIYVYVCVGDKNDTE